VRLKAEKGGEAAVKLEKEERKRLEEDKDEDGEISATSTPVKAGKEAALGLDLSPTRCKGEGARMSPVPEEEDSGYASFLTHSLAPDTSPTLEQALLLPLLDEQEVHKWTELYTQHMDSDYDLADLVRCLKIKCGPLPPPSSSPPTSLSDIAASPGKLFGDLSPPPSSAATTLPPLPPRLGWRAPPTTSHPVSSSPSSKPEEEDEAQTPPSTWSGQLPPKTGRNPSFSNKIFLGGVPWDVTEASLVQAFRQFGPIRIEWPGKDNSPSPPKGYVYIIFDQEESIPRLLAQCTHDRANGGSWYFRLSSHRARSKEVQIIPWMLGDSNYLPRPMQWLDPRKTVFVGALHGMLNAEGLATIFGDLFGGVVYAGIDTDKHRYPIGSGRVTFGNPHSYMKAVAAAFVEIKCQKFCKKVQVDPYLEDALCSSCLLRQGPYFCRELACFHYYCRGCWESRHQSLRSHKLLMRNTRSGGGPATRPMVSLSPPSTPPPPSSHDE